MNEYAFDDLNPRLEAIAKRHGGIIYTRGQPHADYNKQRRLWEIVIDKYSLRVSAIVNFAHCYLELNDLKLVKPSAKVLSVINDLMVLATEINDG